MNSAGSHRRMLILDACVLIDFYNEDSSLLTLTAHSLGQIVVPTPILKEVRQLDERICEQLGLSVVEPEMSVVTEASIRRAGLSFRDRLCLAMAKREGLTLYTNDKALLRAATADGVDAKWGLEILLELVNVGQLPAQGALRSAESIFGRSHFPTEELVAEFKRKLRL